ncbi:DUF3159 domain-containing protein [Stackebrandtia albiflava]
MTEQISAQLGGIRGLIESGVPVGVFVLVNVIWSDRLRWAIGAAVVCAVAIAVVRALRKQSIRHAINGLFGIALGAWLAWDSGDANQFYLPGILYGLAYGGGMLLSVLLRHPFIGWGWSIIAGGGRAEWRDDRRLVKLFSWLTVLWGVVFLTKNLVRLWLYLDGGMADLLGVVTIAFGYPVTGALLLVSFWAVRRRRPALLLRTGD